MARLTRQPQQPLAVHPKYRPIAGIQPGAFGLYDSTGQPLTVGAGITRITNPQGQAIQFGGSAGLTRAVNVTSYPISLVFQGIAGATPAVSFECVSALATSADHLLRVIYDSTGSAFIRAQAYNGGSVATADCNSSVLTGNRITGVAVFQSQADIRFYFRSDQLGNFTATSATDPGVVLPLNQLGFGVYNGSSALYPTNGSINLAQWVNYGFTAAEAARLLDNPWLLFEAPTRQSFIASGAAAPDMPASCVYCGDEGDSIFEAEDTAPFDFSGDAPMDILPPILPELPQSYEWEDVNEDEALYPSYWAQGPPISDLPAETGGQNLIEDARDQPADEEEPFGFEQSGIAPPDQIFVEDASNQPEDSDEDFGFVASPLDAPIADQIFPELDSQSEETEDDSSFYDAPLSADAVVTDPIQGEDSDDKIEEIEEPEGFTDAPLDAVVAADQIYPDCADAQPEDEEPDASFADPPLAFDVVSDQVFTEDSDAQIDDIEEPDGFADAPLQEDDQGAQHIDQPVEDEEIEGFSDAPFDGPLDLSPIYPECSDNQIDTPDDEAFDFAQAPLAADSVLGPVFPTPSQVLAGVVYGPHGNDYTGTLAPSSGGSAYLRRR